MAVQKFPTTLGRAVRKLSTKATQTRLPQDVSELSLAPLPNMSAAKCDRDEGNDKSDRHHTRKQGRQLDVVATRDHDVLRQSASSTPD